MRTERLTVAIAALLLASCSDPFELGADGPTLFTAQVDGVSWAPTNELSTYAYLTPEGHFLVLGFRHDTLSQLRDGIGLEVRHLVGAGRYAFGPDFAGDWGGYAIYNTRDRTDTTFVSTPPNAGEVEITDVDTLNHRIAGRFQFEGQQVEGERRVRLTGGVFRLEYQTTYP